MRIIYGINPVLDLLTAKSDEVQKIAIAKGRTGQEIQRVIELARMHHIAIEFRTRDDLDALAGRNSQGLVAFCKQFMYADLEEVIANKQPPFKNGLILILDSITDPQNMGSLIRTAYFFGANGVVIPENRSASVTPVAVKASSGAAHLLPIAKVTNLSRAIDELKEAGFWIYGTDAHKGEAVGRADFNRDVGLVMGSEGGGLRRLTGEKCDLMISIPGTGKFDSLNVSVSAGIILHRIFEVREKV